jgi:hypothetical protein
MTSGHLNARLATIHQTVIDLVDPMKSAKTNVGSRATASANVSSVIAL